MDSAEKFARMLRLEKPGDRTEIPFFPMIITWSGTCAGITQAEMMRSGAKWLEAMDKTHEYLGMPDVTMCNTPLDTVFFMGLRSRLPGVELGDNELYQFIESDTFTRGAAEYDYIKKVGYRQWRSEYTMKVHHPPLETFEELGARYAQAGMNTGGNIMHFLSRGIQPIYHTAADPIFDGLSMMHSLMEFTVDLFENPGPIMDIITTQTPKEIEDSIAQIKAIHGDRICVYAMRSSSAFVSPAIYKEYVWPPLKLMIEKFWEAGITTVLHADSDWLPMLESFLEVPKSSVHVELDSFTDIYKAYDILGGWQSIAGDVPATMLAFGKPDEVSEYCENLITKIGMKGGFMLSSGCEVPLNAKPECVLAMAESLRK